MNGWQNVVANDGVMIAIAGMTIVFFALAIISGFIALLPRVTGLLARVVPEVEQADEASQPVPPTTSQDQSIAAAIGYAMHLEMREAR